MSSTFTQPLRIFKRNNPSNDGTIAPDNTGAASVTQQQFITNPITSTTSGATVLTTADIGSTTVVPYVLPAGALISNVRFYQTTVPTGLTGGVITVAIVQTSPTDGSLTTTTLGTITPTAAGGVISIAFTASAAVATILNNIGTLDATLTFSAATVTANTGTLGGVFDVSYVARNYDGSITAYGAGLTNS
jgi:hypothetical protein